MKKLKKKSLCNRMIPYFNKISKVVPEFDTIWQYRFEDYLAKIISSCYKRAMFTSSSSKIFSKLFFNYLLRK